MLRGVVRLKVRIDKFALVVVVFLVLVFVVKAESVQVPVAFTSSVNASVTNNSFVFYGLNNLTYNYTLNNVSQSFIFPLSLTQNVTLFNVSLAPDNFSVEALLRVAVANATAYFENVTRTQLVPNVEQYTSLLALRQNDSAECVIGKNVLSNVIAARTVELNASKINFDYMVLAKDAVIANERSEKNTSNLVVALLAVSNAVFILMLLTGMTPKRWFSEFIEQTPGGTARSELSKGKSEGRVR